LIPEVQGIGNPVPFCYYQEWFRHNIIVLARLFTMSGWNPSPMSRRVTKRSYRGGRGSEWLHRRRCLSKDCLEGVDICKPGWRLCSGFGSDWQSAREGPSCYSVTKRYSLLEGIDRSPPQETTNNTVHGAGNNFPIWMHRRLEATVIFEVPAGG
jgi:hypothetical protein